MKIKTLIIAASIMIPVTLPIISNASTFGQNFLSKETQKTSGMTQAAFIQQQRPYEYDVITDKMQYEQQQTIIALLEKIIENQNKEIKLLSVK